MVGQWQLGHSTVIFHPPQYVKCTDGAVYIWSLNGHVTAKQANGDPNRNPHFFHLWCFRRCVFSCRGCPLPFSLCQPGPVLLRPESSECTADGIGYFQIRFSLFQQLAGPLPVPI